jgi:hypothetical protein
VRGLGGLTGRRGFELHGEGPVDHFQPPDSAVDGRCRLWGEAVGVLAESSVLLVDLVSPLYQQLRPGAVYGALQTRK